MLSSLKLVSASLKTNVKYKLGKREYEFKIGDIILIEIKESIAFDPKTGAIFDINQDEYSTNN